MTLAISPEVYTSMGLNEGEYRRILELLGRDPRHTELAMFAVMWSEHCGYKYSRPVLSLFKKYKEAMEGEGLENAGIVDIGDGLGVTMKVESHNHPSAVEPYQGAATGVGGIIRDILTMGARPIAGLNSLRFGPIEDTEGVPAQVIERNRYLFEHVVSGVGGYGNCVGVPTVGGEVGFHPRYSGNPLVNAMCVGLLRLDEITTAGASGLGNPVIYLGSATGRDGIHGATFASDALGEDNDAKRPNVQIGDPFAEKQLIEATLEALQTGAVVAIQDMGAAGLTCSTIEMASKGDVGMAINLDLVPMREADMTAHDLMLSESQERMLAVTYKGREHEVINVFRKWGIKAEVIGHVTDDGKVTVTRFGEVAASIDPKLLTDYCPTYTTPKKEPEYFKKAALFDPNSLPIADLRESLLKLLESPEIASKRWVYRQYDQQVQTQTIIKSGEADAAVLWPRGTKKGLAIKIDGNERQVYLHPYRGGKLAVAEAARNVACTGALPVAATDGLNFGNPQYPHVYWQFAEAVRGIAEAAEVMHTPVISGNVSFYNESDLGEIPPTPLIGMLGILEDAKCAIGSTPDEPCPIWLIYSTQIEIEQQGLGASAYAALVQGIEDGYPEDTSLDAEHKLCQFLSTAASKGLLTFAHDLSSGGLAVAAAEVCMSRYGAKLDLSTKAFDYADSPEAAWFGEVPARVLVGPAKGAESEISALAIFFGLEVEALGNLDESGVFQVRGTGFSPVEVTKTELQQGYLNRIESLMTHPV